MTIPVISSAMKSWCVVGLCGGVVRSYDLANLGICGNAVHGVLERRVDQMFIYITSHEVEGVSIYLPTLSETLLSYHHKVLS